MTAAAVTIVDSVTIVDIAIAFDIRVSHYRSCYCCNYLVLLLLLLLMNRFLIVSARTVYES